jgi:uncharacterized protein YfiM (DUF2279 family)
MRGFVLVFSLATQRPAQAADAWFAEDKLKHFFTSAFVQSMGYGSLRATGVSHPLALAGASAATATLGIGKEVWDAHGHGTPSGKDLAWDAAGAGTITLLLVKSPR